MTYNNIELRDAKAFAKPFLQALVFTAFVALPTLAFATPGEGGGEAGQRVTDFFTDVGALLNAASIAVVTIAVIFAGYQIAFAHKRISDVAPILIGGFLIGAAGQIASMMIDEPTEFGTAAVGMLLQGYA